MGDTARKQMSYLNLTPTPYANGKNQRRKTMKNERRQWRMNGKNSLLFFFFRQWSAHMTQWNSVLFLLKRNRVNFPDDNILFSTQTTTLRCLPYQVMWNKNQNSYFSCSTVVERFKCSNVEMLKSNQLTMRDFSVFERRLKEPWLDHERWFRNGWWWCG